MQIQTPIVKGNGAYPTNKRRTYSVFPCIIKALLPHHKLLLLMSSYSSLSLNLRYRIRWNLRCF